MKKIVTSLKYLREEEFKPSSTAYYKQPKGFEFLGTKNKTAFCVDCGKQITYTAKRCKECHYKFLREGNRYAKNNE